MNYRIWILLFLPLTALLLLGCKNENGTPTESESSFVTVVPITRRNIEITVTATGTLEPLQEIEIKSKASGEIIRLPVKVGDVVEAGDLVAQVDTSDAAIYLRQKRAELDYRRVQCANSEQRRNRAANLLRSGMISLDEHAQSLLEYARDYASLVSAEALLEQAVDRMTESMVRAPDRGTVMKRNVEVGQIISSATSGITGGTALMTIANLATLQAKTLIAESDVGKVQPGQVATIAVDAYGEMVFEGRVSGIIPSALEKDKTVYFPCIVQIDNGDGLLLPGMTCEAAISISVRDSVLVVPNIAIATLKDAEEVAPTLGVPADSLAAFIAKANTHSAGATNMAVVYTIGSGIRPVLVTTGVRHWEYTEIVDGIGDGSEAVVLPSATIARQFRKFREIVNSYSSLPGRR
jgi:HlyD family secretion protein